MDINNYDDKTYINTKKILWFQPYWIILKSFKKIVSINKTVLFYTIALIEIRLISIINNFSNDIKESEINSIW